MHEDNLCLHINEAGLALIMNYEGLVLKPYRCPAGYLTIGYGHRIKTDEIFENFDKVEASKLLAEDLIVFQDAVADLVEVSLNANQFSALVCFTFNVGVEAFKNSTLLRLLNRGWYDQVPAQLLRWDRIKKKESVGLAKRRTAEAQLWSAPLPEPLSNQNDNQPKENGT